MRGTWLILTIMVIAGIGMYFLSTRKPKAADHDTITFKNTPDSIIQKMKVYVADNPTEVIYMDSVWLQSDSTPLKKISDGREEDTMSKKYSAITLYLTYDNRYFYDLELTKANPKLAYNINLAIQPQNNDTLLVDGTVVPQEGDGFRFQNLMLKMYPKFVITYNHKLPAAPADSTAIQGHEPNKTITILQNK